MTAHPQRRRNWICRLSGTKITELANAGTKALIPEAPFAEKNELHFTDVSADL
jgi:hypothetical protein